MKRVSNNLIAIFVILHIFLSVFVITFSLIKADELGEGNVLALSNSAQGTVSLNVVRKEGAPAPAPSPSIGITEAAPVITIPPIPQPEPEKPAVEKPSIITALPVVEFPPGAAVVAKPVPLTTSFLLIGLALFIVNLKIRMRKYTLRNEKIGRYFK